MAARTSPYLLRASFRPDVEIDRDAYPFNIPAVQALGEIEFHPNVTFFVGENGAGKSTVLEALALGLGFGPEGGTKNVRFSTTASVSPLHEALRLARGTPKPNDGYFLRAVFIIATHSPILLAYPNARIIQFDGAGVSEVAYEDTEPYAITRDFLNHHARRVEQVLVD